MFWLSVMQPRRAQGQPLINPFDPKTVIMAKHAQHVALIHFPIALYVSAILFSFIARQTKRDGLAEAAYYNLLGAAISLLPVLATGVLAWQFQLEGQKVKGILLLHIALAGVSTVMIWAVWWMHYRSRRQGKALPRHFGAIEAIGALAILLTAHLGGFLSGVNGPS